MYRLCVCVSLDEQTVFVSVYACLRYCTHTSTPVCRLRAKLTVLLLLMMITKRTNPLFFVHVSKVGFEWRAVTTHNLRIKNNHNNNYYKIETIHEWTKRERERELNKKTKKEELRITTRKKGSRICHGKECIVANNSIVYTHSATSSTMMSSKCECELLGAYLTHTHTLIRYQYGSRVAKA